MKYIDKHVQNTLEIKQSKFIAHLFPFHQFKEKLTELKEIHPKARHFVTASRHLNEFNQVVESSSDDGEPKGTSGKPSLMVLQGQDLINCAVIIVRYFGGTKLGTGGLVRAYSKALNLVIASSELLEYTEEISEKIIFDYTNLSKIEYLCKKFNILVTNKEFGTQAIFELRGSKTEMREFLQNIKELTTFCP